ncbi:MAG: PQQ-binding-like beta-propeller repeat protein, partial [Chitinophagaceae bacterium]
MKKLLLLLLVVMQLAAAAQTKPFRFALVTDTHIGSPSGVAEEDLRRTVADINAMTDVDFVIVSGDITELGTWQELYTAKQILDGLKVRYYIIPGNHDTGWSESGGLGFTKVFGDDKFYLKHNGVHFVANASGPYVRMSDGHIPRHAVNWMKEKLGSIDKSEPIVFINHYPLDEGLDNWYEAIDMLKQKNTVLALCGHGHSNRPVQAEGIPAVMGRSNLRARAAEGGYNLVDVRLDSFTFTERNPLSKSEKKWHSLANRNQLYNLSQTFKRPDYSINQQYKNVAPKWTFQSDANVISTPAVAGKYVVFGNQSGKVQALKLKNGKKGWQFATQGPIFSSPAIADGKIVLGSADGFVYCLNNKGKLQWKLSTNAAVLGAPLIEKGVVYIGGSDSSFRAIELQTGQQLWAFNGLTGPVVSQPVIENNIVIFGAWDTYLYALNKNNGELLWKWSNGSPVRNFSPASVIPVIKDGAVYIAAPDRFLSAIDLETGKTLWRTKES